MLYIGCHGCNFPDLSPPMSLGVIIYNGKILKVTIDNPTSNYNDILVSYVIQFLLKILYVSVLEHSFFKLTEQFTVSYNKIGCKHSCKKSNIYMYFKKQYFFFLRPELKSCRAFY